MAAIADFTKAIEIDPTKIQAHFNRANAYSFLDNYSAAIRDVSCAIEIAPNNKVGYLNRGYLFFRARDYHAAIADFSSAIRLEPNFSEAHFLHQLINLLGNLQVLQKFSDSLPLKKFNFMFL